MYISDITYAVGVEYYVYLCNVVFETSIELNLKKKKLLFVKTFKGCVKGEQKNYTILWQYNKKKTHKRCA